MGECPEGPLEVRDSVQGQPYDAQGDTCLAMCQELRQSKLHIRHIPLAWSYVPPSVHLLRTYILFCFVVTPNGTLYSEITPSMLGECWDQTKVDDTQIMHSACCPTTVLRELEWTFKALVLLQSLSSRLTILRAAVHTLQNPQA